MRCVYKMILLLIVLSLPAAPLLAKNVWQGCSGVTEIPVSECEALVALYYSTYGLTWKKNTGWLQSNRPCSWYGVQCKKGNVTWLSLQNNQLIGSLPPDLGALLELRGINLFNNQLSGEIPRTLSNLLELRELRLNSNRLNGSIFPELGRLTRLTELYLSNNRLAGEIPSELGSLSGLQQLHLNNNRLSGSIPVTLGNLARLEVIRMGDNRLIGPLPSELGWLSSLRLLHLQDNRLSGSLPLELGRLSSLRSLHLQNNQLSGSLPPTLGELGGLETLWLSNNQLSGELPPKLGRLARLEVLRLDNNQLSGPIPRELGNLSSLVVLSLVNNQLSGEIPSELGELTSLRDLSLAHNRLNEDIARQLTVKSSGLDNHSVEIVGNPTRYSGKPDYSVDNIENKTVIHLTAPVTAGTWSQRKKLVSWNGCDFMFGRTCTVRMLSNKTVTVKYAAKDSKTVDSSNTLKNFFEQLKEFDEEYDARHSQPPDFCNSLEIVLKNPEKLDVRYYVIPYDPITGSGAGGLPKVIRIPESVAIISTAQAWKDVEWKSHVDVPLYTVIVTEKCDGSTTRVIQPIGLGGMIHEESTSFEDMKSKITVTVTSSLSAADEEEVRRNFLDLPGKIK